MLLLLLSDDFLLAPASASAVSDDAPIFVLDLMSRCDFKERRRYNFKS